MIEIDFTTKPKEITPSYVTKAGVNYLYDENGEWHSYNDLPAIVFKSGERHWYKHGIRHRDNDLPAIIWAGGAEQYYVNGERIHK